MLIGREDTVAYSSIETGNLIEGEGEGEAETTRSKNADMILGDAVFDGLSLSRDGDRDLKGSGDERQD